jgi:hypothetical protein
MNDKKHEKVIEIVEPPVGKVRVRDGKINVQVRVTGDLRVRAVRAQAFRGEAPDTPETKLTRAEVPGVYVGTIPAFLGLFEIKAMVEFEEGPPRSCEEGPYKGVRDFTTNEADIICPDPGEVKIKAADNKFRVRVWAVADDPNTVGDVFAQCIRTDGTPIGSEVKLDSLGGDIWAKDIEGQHGDFRIVARAVILDEDGQPIAEAPDEDGVYTGCPHTSATPCP